MSNELQTFLEKHTEPLKSYAVANYDQRAFMSSVRLAIMNTPAIMKAIKTPSGQTSLFDALKFASSTGLSLNPQEGKAALIAYGDTIQYQIMKNGIIELAMQSGKVEFVTADIVRENDDFTISKSGNGDEYEFKPARKNRGKVDGYYAACKMKDGVTHVMYMEKSEVEEHAEKYSALFRTKPDASPWKKSFDGMAIKTVLKRLFRNIVISPAVSAAIGGDDASEAKEKDVTPAKGVSTAQLSEKLEEPEPVKPDVKTEVEEPEKAEKPKEMF